MGPRAWRAVAVLMFVGCGGGGSSSGGSIDGARPVTDFEGVPFGATCGSDADCGGQADSCCTGAECSMAGWCSPKCQSDQDCPDGFYCIDHAGTRCFSACADDRECPTGFVCEEKSGHLTCRYKP